MYACHVAIVTSYCEKRDGLKNSQREVTKELRKEDNLFIGDKLS